MELENWCWILAGLSRSLVLRAVKWSLHYREIVALSLPLWCAVLLLPKDEIRYWTRTLFRDDWNSLIPRKITLTLTPSQIVRFHLISRDHLFCN